MIKQLGVAVIFLLSASGVRAQHRPLVEVFLVDKVAEVDTLESRAGYQSGYFACTSADLPQQPLLADSDLVGYQVPTGAAAAAAYTFYLSAAGQQKLAQLQSLRMPLCCGQRFVVAIDRQPVYGGYFWNPASSFGCPWLVGGAGAAGTLAIEAGLPNRYFTKNHPDPRGSSRLLEALKATGRLR